MTKLDQAELEERINRLRKLCDSVDPYSPLKKEIEQELQSFDIDTNAGPFKLTNQLLLLMETSLEELENRTKTIH